MPLDFDGFGDSQCLLKLNAEVSDSAVHLGVAYQELNRAKVACRLVNLDNLGASHRVRAVGAALPAKGIPARP